MTPLTKGRTRLIPIDDMRARVRARYERDGSKIASVTDGGAGGCRYRGRSRRSGDAATERSGNEREGKEESSEGTSSQVLELERPWSSVFECGAGTVPGFCRDMVYLVECGSGAIETMKRRQIVWEGTMWLPYEDSKVPYLYWAPAMSASRVRGHYVSRSSSDSRSMGWWCIVNSCSGYLCNSNPTWLRR